MHRALSALFSRLSFLRSPPKSSLPQSMRRLFKGRLNNVNFPCLTTSPRFKMSMARFDSYDFFKAFGPLFFGRKTGSKLKDIKEIESLGELPHPQQAQIPNGKPPSQKPSN